MTRQPLRTIGTGFRALATRLISIPKMRTGLSLSLHRAGFVLPARLARARGNVLIRNHIAGHVSLFGNINRARDATGDQGSANHLRRFPSMPGDDVFDLHGDSEKGGRPEPPSRSAYEPQAVQF